MWNADLVSESSTHLEEVVGHLPSFSCDCNGLHLVLSSRRAKVERLVLGWVIEAGDGNSWIRSIVECERRVKEGKEGNGKEHW